MTLPTFPSELIGKILSRLNVADLHSTALTSPALRKVANSILFKELVIPSNRSSLKLCQALLRNPDLGHDVRHVSFAYAERRYPFEYLPNVPHPGSLGPRGFPSLPSPPLSQSDLDQARYVLQHAASPVPDREVVSWSALLSAGSFQAAAVIIILLCSNLRSLELNQPASDFHFPPFLLVNLPELRNFTLKWHKIPVDSPVSWDHPADYDLVVAALQNPVIDCIRLHITDPVRDTSATTLEDALRSIPEGSCKGPQALYLEKSYLVSASFGVLLEKCPRLHTLEADLYWDGCSSNRTIDCATLGRQLGKLPMLKHLGYKIKIWPSQAADPSMTGGDPDSGDMWGVKGRVGSLKHLKLETLEMSLVVLLGWTPSKLDQSLGDILPRNLRSLCLTDDMGDFLYWKWEGEDLLGVLCPYIEARDTAPSLERVEMSLVWDEEGGVPGDMLEPHNRSRLREVCATARVQCAILDL
ncbi:uncharacterized protein K452DRAFT_301735 [Aplosporella prunicola CBS 121167]|uniref:F-box domain-containing protein n=1 Tax=Aplosporella prunicola CBS 121167 TaxID=1176127 RepID=A0A6A6B4S7_9PEZI|nr:uncharacterized protein K452DRAFT_301735 [Aplosporella prunicola CBS 121167]KAF2137761.1 hypothetical protein K452DRAFT_301735 [Aplosporella prunicola CBS 121167]